MLYVLPWWRKKENVPRYAFAHCGRCWNWRGSCNCRTVPECHTLGVSLVGRVANAKSNLRHYSLERRISIVLHALAAKNEIAEKSADLCNSENGTIGGDVNVHQCSTKFWCKRAEPTDLFSSRFSGNPMGNGNWIRSPFFPSLRDHPDMMYTNILDFLTISPLVHIWNWFIL